MTDYYSLCTVIYSLLVLQECRGCGEVISKGSVAVVAPRCGEEATWHPACFTCATCKELLVDLVYCVWEETVLCGRHYAEQLKPRCAACDEVSERFLTVSLTLLNPIVHYPTL